MDDKHFCVPLSYPPPPPISVSLVLSLLCFLSSFFFLSPFLPSCLLACLLFLSFSPILSFGLSFLPLPRLFLLHSGSLIHRIVEDLLGPNEGLTRLFRRVLPVHLPPRLAPEDATESAIDQAAIRGALSVIASLYPLPSSQNEGPELGLFLFLLFHPNFFASSKSISLASLLCKKREQNRGRSSAGADRT